MGGAVRIGIFRKFGLFALVTGVLPLVITVLILSSRMHDEFIGVMETNYSQMTLSLQDRLDSTLGVYDTITTMPYYYSFDPEENYLPFDIFRRIFYGTGYDDETMEEDRRRDVESFLLNLIRSDSYILSAYFIGLDSDGSMLSFGVDSATGFHLGYDDYYLIQDWNVHDKTDRRMQIHPFRTQSTGHRIFTVSRNYFDIRGNVQDLGYVGTLYLNIDARRIESIVRSVKGGRNDGILLTHDGICWYSDNPADIGKPFAIDDDKRLFYSADSRYGVVSNIVVDPDDSYRAVETLYTLAFGLLFLSVILFSIGIMSVSKRFSKQMEGLFRGMDRVEKGDFDVPALKDNGDELGLLYDRFRNMGTALNSLLQKEISSAAGKIKAVDLSLGMENPNGEEGLDNMDISYKISKRFLNDRFNIVIGGTISTGSNAAESNKESFIDNISVEYRLDNSGTRYVKVFHNKNYESVLEGEITETGAGIVLRKKMLRLKELFTFKRKKAITQANDETNDR